MNPGHKICFSHVGHVETVVFVFTIWPFQPLDYLTNPKDSYAVSSEPIAVSRFILFAFQGLIPNTQLVVS